MPEPNSAAVPSSVPIPPTTAGRRVSRGGRWTSAKRRHALWRPRTRILVADAESLSRRRLSAALRSRGYEVREQQNGAALLEFLGTHLMRRPGLPPFELMILDARMPGADGLVVLVAMQRMGWQIPTIMVATTGDVIVHARAPDLGAIAVLDKPLDADAVTQYVAHIEPP